MIFLGHFPEKAIMPGALIIEAMAQASIILFATSEKKRELRQKALLLFRFGQSAIPSSCGTG